MSTHVNDVEFLVYALAQYVGSFHFFPDIVEQFHHLMANSMFAILAYLWKAVPLFTGSYSVRRDYESD